MRKERIKPPALAVLLLRKFCPKDYQEEIIGDLEEVFDWRLTQKSPLWAKFRFFLDVLSALRFYKGGRTVQLISNAMLFSFFKSAMRNFRRHLGYTSLNVLGLALGLAAALLIMEYVSDELSYNQSSRADQLYRVSNDYYRYGKMVYNSSQTFASVGPDMVTDLPEVLSYARLYNASLGWGGAMILTSIDNPGLKNREEHLYFTDPTLPDYFDLKLVNGTNQLAEPNTIIISTGLAERYFGSVAAALNQTIRYNDDLHAFELKVTGVYQKPQFNLQADLDGLISYVTKAQTNPDRFNNNWRTNSVMAFVELMPNTDPKKIEKDLSALSLKYKPDYLETNEQGEPNRVNHYFLSPIADIHLHSKYQNEIGPVGDATTVNMLQVIAVFIVVIAWINFINLSTARSIDRAKEVGLRKVMGANRGELVIQFFVEAALVNLLALVLAVIMVLVAQPLFNAFVKMPLHLTDIDLQKFGTLATLVFVIGTALSGLYPAFILSSHVVITALKSNSKSGKGLLVRRGLIAFQLLFSFLLIMATMAIRGQLNFMNNQDLGFEPEQVLVLKGPTIREGNRERRARQMELFKTQAATLPDVSSVGSAGIIPGVGILRGVVLTRYKEDGDMNSIERLVVDDEFLSTMRMEFVAGNDFINHPNEKNPIIITVAAAKVLGFEEPDAAIGETIFEFSQEERKVVGVVNDFHQESLNMAKDPMYFIRNERVNTYIAVRLNTKATSTVVERVSDLYDELFPGNPLESYFLDDFFGRQYARNELNQKVFSAFAFMAIVVACLGLYGLSSFSALQRTKEIGVRKVLGASVPDLFVLLSKEVYILVGIGFLLALPVGYWTIDSWLSSFAYRMEVGPLLFLIPLFMIITITFLATARRILKVALTNPVKSLRYE